jgi:hypothetical protein
MARAELTTKSTKDTKLLDNFPELRALRVLFENTCASTISAQRIDMSLPSYRRKPVSIPSLPWMPAFAGMTNQGMNRVVLGASISYSVDARKLMDASW